MGHDCARSYATKLLQYELKTSFHMMAVVSHDYALVSYDIRNNMLARLLHRSFRSGALTHYVAIPLQIQKGQKLLHRYRRFTLLEALDILRCL
jgi:hypothetical protein